MARRISRERLRSFPLVAQRLEEARWGTVAEATAVLREVLEGSPRPDGQDVNFRLWEAAMISWCLLAGGDRSEDPPEKVLAEIGDDGRLPGGLKDLLRRLLDREATDRVTDVSDAIERLIPLAGEPVRVLPAPAPGPQAPPSRSRRSVARFGLIAIGVFLAGLLAFKIATTGRQLADPMPTSSIAGTSVDVIPKDRFDPMAPTWANGASASSNGSYSDRLIGWPDVFPRTAHANAAWYPYRQDRGSEWIVVNWNAAWEAQEIVVLETFHPGAIVAVDDVEDFLENSLGAFRFVRLWSGKTQGATESRALRFVLAAPRRIAALRVVLDTKLVTGLTEIDAVGIIGPRARR